MIERVASSVLLINLEYTRTVDTRIVETVQRHKINSAKLNLLANIVTHK